MRARESQLDKTYPEPPGPGHLTIKAYDSRKQAMSDQHQAFHDNWAAQGGMPHHFDVGRLSSPMWQVYRNFFNKQHKEKKRPERAGKKRYRKPLKADWESKWEHPDKHGQTTKEMLNMTTEQRDIDEVTNNEWISNQVVDDVLKKDFVDLKHKSKNDGNAENIMVIPSTFWQAIGRLNVDPAELKRYAKYKFWKGQAPQDYSKVLIPFVDAGHWVLAVMNFEKDRLEIYDSKFKAESYYWSIRRSFKNFLKVANGDSGKLCDTFFLDTKVPHQSDGHSCGLYVIAFARSIMKHTPFPQTYDSAMNSTKDLEKVLRADRVHLVAKLQKYRTQKFRGHKYTGSQKDIADKAAAKAQRKQEKARKKAEEEAKKKEEEAKKKEEADAKQAQVREDGKKKMFEVMKTRQWKTPAPEPEPEAWRKPTIRKKATPRKRK
jgi:hypothetical protein